eukprot:8591617-Pyramimonas_sp.AAC.1
MDELRDDEEEELDDEDELEEELAGRGTRGSQRGASEARSSSDAREGCARRIALTPARAQA